VWPWVMEAPPFHSSTAWRSALLAWLKISATTGPRISATWPQPTSPGG
jgi:hypothetical protein